jgi:hypothetical protein
VSDMYPFNLVPHASTPSSWHASGLGEAVGFHVWMVRNSMLPPSFLVPMSNPRTDPTSKAESSTLRV